MFVTFFCSLLLLFIAAKHVVLIMNVERTHRLCFVSVMSVPQMIERISPNPTRALCLPFLILRTSASCHTRIFRDTQERAEPEALTIASPADHWSVRLFQHVLPHCPLRAHRTRRCFTEATIASFLSLGHRLRRMGFCLCCLEVEAIHKESKPIY